MISTVSAPKAEPMQSEEVYGMAPTTFAATAGDGRSSPPAPEVGIDLIKLRHYLLKKSMA